MPPTSWTSKWRSPMVRLEASRQSAKASIRSSSRSSPSCARRRSSSERSRRPASSRASSSGSSLVIAAATERWRLISRSFGSNSLVRLDTGSRLPGWGKPQTGLSGDDRLDYSHRTVGAPEGDLDLARILVKEDMEALAVGLQLSDRILNRHRPQLHANSLRLRRPLLTFVCWWDAHR